jgi:hypothetical protein
VFLVAPEAKSPEIGKIALTPSFGHRKDMVRIPEAFSLGIHVKLALQCFPFLQRNQLKPAVELNGIQTADRADASIAPKHLFAQIAGIRSQTPLVNAAVVAESPSALRHFNLAPSADTSAMRAPLPGLSNPAAGLLPFGAHHFSGGLILV